MTERAALRRTILAMVTARGLEKTICPSEAARAVAGEGGDWRALMDETRAVAAQLVEEERIVVTQKGAVVDTRAARGPIRLRLAGQGAG